jgi:hypothetical protein
MLLTGRARVATKGDTMTAPTATAFLDAAAYSPGDRMTLTVTYGDADTQTVTITFAVTDARGNSSAPTEATVVIDPLTVTVSDDSGRTWTRLSDTGTVATYWAVA